MRVSWRMVMTALLAVVVLIAGCSGGANQQGNNDAEPLRIDAGEPVKAAFTDNRLAGMKGIADNGKLKLFIDEETAEIAILNAASGDIWRSNPESRSSDTVAGGTNKDLLSAQARITYNTTLGQSGNINTYTDSVAHKQMAYEAIPNGIRVIYQLGKDERTVESLPQMLSKERFDEISSKLDNTGKRSLIIAYKEDKDKGVYVRNDNALRGIQIARTFEAFDNAGYTEEDLARDNAEHGLESPDLVPRIFNITIEYTLDDDSLLVKVPSDSIKYPAAYPVNQISLLSFFGAGGTEESGSMLVPDGSGALIHFNNGKAKYPAYQQSVFGRDMTMDSLDFFSRDQKVRLPVFGVIKDNSAFLAIIEEGASVATINADVAGRLNSYNYVYPSFYVINRETITLRANDKQRELPKFQEQPMRTDYAVRYAFFAGKDASYQGMAQYYREYLIDKQVLRKNNQASRNDIPFYLQLIGSIDKRKHVVGIPYQSIEPMTTLDQAKEIISELKERNIDHIKLNYIGWFNGGIDHKVPDDIKVNRAIGGRKALSDFLDYAADEGIAFYPDVAISSVNNTKGFRQTRDASRRLTEEPAAVYPIDQAMNRRDRDRSPSYVLSPRLISEHVDGMLKDLKKLQVTQLSLRDLADQLNSDYRKRKQIDRTEAEKITIEALENIAGEGMTIMANGANAYAFPYLTDITNAPMSSSGFKIEDEEIPFYQMVIRGYIDYTGAPYNLSTYTNHNQYLLRTLEYGSNPYFTWSYEPNYKVKETEYDYYYAVYYGQWIDLAEKMYAEANEVLRHAVGQPIASHEKLADGVFKTTFENGFHVTVNYNASPVTVGGIVIEAESYATGGEPS